MLRLPPERVLRPLAAFGVAALILFVARGADAQSRFPSELQTVSRVRFPGRHHVAAKELQSVMKTREASWMPWRERPVLRLDFLRADTAAIEGIYRQHGFLDAIARATVRPQSDVNLAEVWFTIEEGSRSKIRAIEFSGVTVYPEKQLRQRLYSRRGQPFNPSAMIADTTRIDESYQERGYRPHVSADTLRRGDEVTIRFHVQEGPLYRFGEVDISSPDPVPVRRSLVTRELDIRPGDIYRRSRIQRSVERLYATDLFRSIQVTPLPDSNAALMEIDMRLEARKRRWIDGGIGSGTFERFSVNASWGHRNLLDRGLAGSLGSRLSFDGNAKFLLWRSEATLLSPWLLGTRTSGQVTGYYAKSDDRQTDARFELHQDGPGIQFQVRREFSRILKLTATQNNASIRQNYSIIPDTSAVLRDSLLRNVAPRYVTRLLNLSLDRDLRDDPLNTTKGSTQSISGEIAGGPLKGSSSYAKGLSSSAWYTPIQRDWLLAIQIRGGMAAPFGENVQFSPADSLVDPQVSRVPVENRFRIGGVNSIRGFADNSLPTGGGLAMLQANIELRARLLGPFGVEFFIDAGNVWARASDIKLRDFRFRRSYTAAPGDVRYAMGIGPRLQLPFGPLRLDLTLVRNPPDPGRRRILIPEIQFAIGPSF